MASGVSRDKLGEPPCMGVERQYTRRTTGRACREREEPLYEHPAERS